jgi:hypothetical protein
LDAAYVTRFAVPRQPSSYRVQDTKFTNRPLCSGALRWPETG